MNLLADESCAGPVVRALREAGHDLTAIAEIAKGATDEEVSRACSTKSACSSRKTWILADWCTRGRPTAGVLLVRFPNSARAAKPATVIEVVARLGSRLQRAFGVVEPGRVRVSSGP